MARRARGSGSEQNVIVGIIEHSGGVIGGLDVMCRVGCA
jgi:hypothetical protein